MSDALFPPPPPGHNIGLRNDSGERVSPSKTIRQAQCPHCWKYSHKTVGVIRDTDLATHKQREVFKDHTKILGAGSVPCIGSGQEAPLA
jgi:hypothetical protein